MNNNNNDSNITVDSACPCGWKSVNKLRAERLCGFDKYTTVLLYTFFFLKKKFLKTKPNTIQFNVEHNISVKYCCWRLERLSSYIRSRLEATHKKKILNNTRQWWFCDVRKFNMIIVAAAVTGPASR